MPKVSDIPVSLRPYVWHGVDLATGKGGDQIPGDCPFCGREGKFVVNVNDGRWRCLVCATGTVKGGGNHYTFLTTLLDQSQRSTKEGTLEELAEDRGLLSHEPLKEWGVCKSYITDEWIIPGYSVNGKLVQLYRWVYSSERGKKLLWPTPGLDHKNALFGVQHLDPKKSRVYVCEGPWDGAAWWEILQLTQLNAGRYKPTASTEDCLYADADVIAVPGCGTFAESWCRLLDGKEVVLLYDNDHPLTHTNGSPTPKITEPAAYGGMKRVTRLLSESEYQPKSVKYLAWGGQGRTHDPKLPHGYDLRDHMALGKDSLTERVARVGEILSLVKPVPEEWVPGRSRIATKVGGLTLECLPCTSWKELVNECKKAMKWTEGLDRAFSVMFACVLSTELPGDQIWIKLVGPPSCGKSTLCEAITVAKKYVIAKSKIKGFHSGFQKTKDNAENVSLIGKVANKTLITKDGDTFLQSPNLGEIMSELRDLYDRVARSDYRNDMSKDWSNINMTFILAGTSALRYLDASELGQRFLDCVIMEGIEDDFEQDICRRASNDMDDLLRDLDRPTGGDGESPEMLLMKQKAGGYVNHLRKNYRKLVSQVKVSRESLTRCENLGRLIALIRARPSKKQDEEVTRELGARLVKQLVKLARCLAAVLNREEVDDEVMRRVRKVAWDTARGRSLNIVQHLYRAGETGSQIKTLCLHTHMPHAKEHELLRFLKRINVVEVHLYKPPRHQVAKPHWRLTDYMREIYSKALGEEH